MPNRARRHVWSRRGALAGAGAILALAASSPAAAPPDDAGSGSPLTDQARLLTGRERAALESLLRVKATESGALLTALVVPHLPQHQTVEELAAQAFTASDPRPGTAAHPRVLLVVSLKERRAAIETGQGPAGIVPEIDAGAIVQRLSAALAHQRLSAALADAIAAVATSARATAERRRPLPPEPQDVRAPAPAAVPAPLGEPGAEETATTPEEPRVPATDPQPGRPRRRSVMPAAYVLAGLVLIGLAIRRRRRLPDDRVTPPPGRPTLPTKLDRDVKSIGDRSRS